jgi:hypothetical protein
MSKLGARRRRLARLRDARAGAALRRHFLLALLAVAAMLFAAGCRVLTPGAGAEGPGDQCPDQQAAAEPVAQPAASGAAAIAETATSINTDANEIARLSRSQRGNARAIAFVARQIAADANRLANAGGEAAAPAPAEGAADQQASASADQASTDEAAAASRRDTSVEGTAARMATGGRFIAGRAGRIAQQSNNTRVDELANGIVTKAESIVTEAEALGSDEPAETTTTAPAEECDETTTTGAGGEETTTTTGGGEETTTTQGDGETTTTAAPTTTLPPIDLQNCDPGGLKSHTGIQTRDGQDVCHTAIFGVIPGAGKIPAVRILEPANNATIPVGQTFTATIKFRNWQGGIFDDPAAQYGVRPFSLAPDPNDPNRQIPIGHAHIYVQRLVDGEVPAETLDSFLALNQASEDGETLSGTVPAVANPGQYRVCTDLAGGNHLTFPKGVAQAIPQMDCVQVTFQ